LSGTRESNASYVASMLGFSVSLQVVSHTWLRVQVPVLPSGFRHSDGFPHVAASWNRSVQGLPIGIGAYKAYRFKHVEGFSHVAAYSKVAGMLAPQDSKPYFSDRIAALVIAARNARGARGKPLHFDATLRM
jgi:hypothetical protein